MNLFLKDSISHLLTPTQLAEESNALTVLPLRTKMLCEVEFIRVRHFTPTYDMTKKLQEDTFV